MAVSPLPRPEADTPAYLLMSAMLSCPVCLLSGQKRRKQTFKTPAPARANPVSGTIPLSREIRNLKRRGLSAGSKFGSCLGAFGQGIWLDPILTPSKIENPASLVSVIVPRAAGCFAECRVQGRRALQPCSDPARRQGTAVENSKAWTCV